MMSGTYDYFVLEADIEYDAGRAALDKMKKEVG